MQSLLGLENGMNLRFEACEERLDKVEGKCTTMIETL